MNAGNLRHRITIERNAEVVDPLTGYHTSGWSPLLEDVPAQWLAGPGREYLAGEALRSAVSGRFKVRWSPATMSITAGDRVLWDGRTMEVKAPPMVDATARREITLMVAEDGTDGT